jgi:hypothetical protein
VKIGKRDECRHCGRPVMICRTPGGKWLPFNLDMIEANPEAMDAYVPIRSGPAVALVPVADVAPRQIADVRWFARRHRCPEFMRAAANGQRDEVDSLGDAIEEHFGR